MSRRLFELILAVRRKCQASEEQIQQGLGLSPAEFNALIVMDDGGEITGFEFAEHMALSPSRSSRILSRLVTDGYVRTHPNTQDRRTIMISLTPKGTRTKQRILAHMEACEERICRTLDQERLAQMRQALKLLEAAL